MAAEEKKDVPPVLGDGNDEALLEDLNLEEVEGLAGIQVESGRPLPKKVELDIDDLLLEDEEEAGPPPEPEEAPPGEEPAPAAPEKEAEEPKARISPIKLALVAGPLALVLIAVVIGFFMLRGEKPTPPPPTPVKEGPARVELLPFVINFPTEDKEVVFELEMAVYFSNKQAQREFKERTMVLRDLIFRFMQGHAPSELAEPEAKEKLATELGNLIDLHLDLGKVRRVQLIKLGAV